MILCVEKGLPLLILFFICFSKSGFVVSSSKEIVYAETENDYVVPDIVHQVYDYQSPNLFLYLSVLSVQYFHRPKRHILWVNDEGRFRKAHWESWQRNRKPNTWENHFYELIHTNKSLEIKFITFPSHPPGNESTFVSNKAHKSDFVRMKVLKEMGGIYIDTDAIVTRPLHELRKHPFTLAYDNLVFPMEPSLPKRLNNGVILSAKDAIFLKLWMKEYQHFHVQSFDYDSSVVPYQLASLYPDLIHIEMSRISPISYGFQTSQVAEAITCGLYIPPGSLAPALLSSSNSMLKSLFTIEELTEWNQMGAIWYPEYSSERKQFQFEGTKPDLFMHQSMQRKLILHLTMSQVRGICMMRKHLSETNHFEQMMPSYLGHLFRMAYSQRDNFPYELVLHKESLEEKLTRFKTCRDFLGMHTMPEKEDIVKNRQQYVRWKYFNE